MRPQERICGRVPECNTSRHHQGKVRAPQEEIRRQGGPLLSGLAGDGDCSRGTVISCKKIIVPALFPQKRYPPTPISASVTPAARIHLPDDAACAHRSLPVPAVVLREKVERRRAACAISNCHHRCPADSYAPRCLIRVRLA